MNLRQLVLGLVAVVLVGLAGCGGVDAARTTTTEAAVTSQAATTTEAAATTTEATTTAAAAMTTTRPPTTTTTEPNPGDLLAFAGFAGFMGDYSWDGVVIIESVATGPILVNSAQIILRNATGSIIDTEYLYRTLVYPGTNYFNVSLFEPAAEPTEVEVKYDEARTLDAGRFTVSNLQVVTGSYGSVGISGEVSSTFEADQDFVTLLVVFFAADGSPLFSETAYIDLVEGGGTTLFSESIYLDEFAPSWDHAEVHAQL